jgi:hypothetical protein
MQKVLVRTTLADNCAQRAVLHRARVEAASVSLRNDSSARVKVDEVSRLQVLDICSRPQDRDQDAGNHAKRENSYDSALHV